MVHGKFVDDVKKGRQEQVRGGRGGERREARRTGWNGGFEGPEDDRQPLLQRVTGDIVRAGWRSMTSWQFAHASIDEVVGVILQEGLVERGRVLLAVEDTYSNGFETVATTLNETAQNARVESEQGDAQVLPPLRPCWNVRVPWRRVHGRQKSCSSKRHCAGGASGYFSGINISLNGVVDQIHRPGQT